MYDDDDNSSDSNYDVSDKDNSRKRKKKTVKKTRTDLTWVEAAEIVLSRHDRPLPHKEILKLIEQSNLKSRGRGTSAPLAVLNSMLNSHSRGPGAIFYRAAQGSACFGLTKNLKSSKTAVHSQVPLASDAKIIGKAKTFADLKKGGISKQKLTPPAKYNPPVRQLKPPLHLSGYASSTMKKRQLIPPGGLPVKNRSSPTLGNMSKETYDRLKQQPQHRRMGPTIASLVRPAPPFSRPPPGAALRVMPPKKRVKLDEDEHDTDSSGKSDSIKIREKTVEASTKSKSTKVEETTRRESQRTLLKSQQQSKLTPPQPVSSKQQLQPPKEVHQKTAMERRKDKPIAKSNRTSRPTISRTSSRSSLSLKHPPQLNNKKNVSGLSTGTEKTESSEQSKNTFLGVKFKKMKKANLADQIKRSKEGKLDLMSPDSILTTVHIKDLLNEGTFRSLPPAYQYQLLMLLPKCDKQVGNDGALRLSTNALNNAFFTRACQEFKDKLMDGEFNSDMIQRAKNELQLNTKLDSWKAKFFEPVYGQSSLDDKNDDIPLPKLEPVESSWSAFLKFAENATDDFDEALAKIQLEVKKLAEKEAKKKEEWDRRKKEETANLAAKHKKTLSRVNVTNLQSPTSRSPVSLKPKTNRTDAANKEKSRRALRRAQLLQRKKAFDKQLKDAKAKIVEEARFGARKDEETTSIKVENFYSPTKESINSNKPQTTKLLASISSEPVTISSVQPTTLIANNILNSSPNKIPNSTEKENSSTIINISDSATLRDLIITSENSKQAKKSTKTKPTKGLTTSRILHGPSSYGTNNEGRCPCNLKAMVVCEQCGSFWHGDCVNSDKICILCTS